ncbi:hypothetical protein [Paenibacillus tarimensis]|uniref:hypothetical protein n=1 Tax=Paenibacillus tarimensis TaxID=416012 RepID=UPI001F1EDB50|nr:hypothetical protein [Paenibacillus tarimensis]MCF2942096.1 hypothetical protein [Paenibacillus tarimensis]
MNVQYMTGIEMALPEGKLPGFYAQVIKKLASSGGIADRDKNLLFVHPDRLEAVMEILHAYKAETETGPWLLLGSSNDGWETRSLWMDYGVETRSGNLFADSQLAAAVQLKGNVEGAEIHPASMQLEEHAIALHQASRLYVIDRQLLPLAESIGKAYHCLVTEFSGKP